MRSAAAFELADGPEPPELAVVVGRLAEHALEAIVTLRSDGTVVGWNPRATRLFGWSAAEAIGRHLSETVPARRQQAQLRSALRRCRVGGAGSAAERLELVARHRDGTMLPVEVALAAFEDHGGPTLVAFIRDLAEQRAVERALRETEARHQSLVEQLPGIVYIDEIGAIGRYVSPQVETILGYTPEQWLADHDLWRRALHPEDRERALGELAAGEKSGASFTLIYRLVARDGRTVWIRDQASVRQAETGERTVHGVMFDISREVGNQTELELELTERREIGEALRRLPYGRPADETADAVCHELLRLPGADIAVVYEFAHDGSVTPVGVAGPPGLPIRIGEPLPTQRAAYLRDSATGPWIDEWQPRQGDSGYDRAWLDLGLRVAAYVPFGAGERTFGLLAVGSLQPIGTPGASRWLPAVTEFGAITAALLASELGSRRQLEGLRADLSEIIRTRAFAAVFQPIVRLGDNDVVGYEALTRFADGTPPDRWFENAEAIGAAAELEAATMRQAFEEAGALPSRAWLSLNLSPGRLADAELARLLGAAGGRPLVLEITERTPIDDYEVVRNVLDGLARGVDVAVDDAGAGFSSLRHIIELRPRYVKLDLQLVRGVDGDPARQAMIAGMVFFARDAGCLLIAEGVETPAERDALRRLGVPFGQGYLFGRPAPASHWTE